MKKCCEKDDKPIALLAAVIMVIAAIVITMILSTACVLAGEHDWNSDYQEYNPTMDTLRYESIQGDPDVQWQHYQQERDLQDRYLQELRAIEENNSVLRDNWNY